MAVTINCDAPDCGEEVEPEDLTEIVVQRKGEASIAHLHNSCFETIIGGDETLVAVLIG